MIKGVGTDLCHISRMRKAVERQHFIDRVFHQCEIDYAREHGDPARHYASAYAAKEALAKRVGFDAHGVKKLLGSKNPQRSRDGVERNAGASAQPACC